MVQGLAEQLLNVVVKHERADLEEQRESLIQQMSSNKVLLSKLEESLLSNLSNASGNILDNQVGIVMPFTARAETLHHMTSCVNSNEILPCFTGCHRMAFCPG